MTNPSNTLSPTLDAAWPPLLSDLRASHRRAAMLREVADALRGATGEATHIQAVIAHTSLSHGEIVAQFGSVGGLVTALADMFGRFMLAPLDGNPNDRTDAEFTRKLVAFGRRVVDPAGAAQLKALYRVALADSIREPALGRTFYRHGPGLVMEGLSRFLSDARDAGLRLRGDSRLLASHLMALLRIDLGLPEDDAGAGSGEGVPDAREVSRIIALFCAGIQRSPEDADAAV